MTFKSYWKLLKLSLVVTLTVILLLASLAPLSAQEDEETCEGLVILGAWARPALEDGNTAFYGIIVNLGDEDEMLTAASSSVADTLELHESQMADDGMMQMHPLDKGIHIPAHGAALLEPGGMHIMAISVTETLEINGAVDFQLTLMAAGDIHLEVPVGEPEEPAIHAFNTEYCEPLGFWGAWARPAELENGNSAIYGILLNLSDEDDVLVEATTEAAQLTELHESKMQDDGTMQMSMLEDGILLPASSFVVLEPGGIHIMLMNVTEPLLEGEEIEVSLTFESEALFETVVPIRPDDSAKEPMTNHMK